MARPRTFNETTALGAAAQLFWSQGYDATSMSDLERHLGLGRQSIYNTFGDKRSLFLKALEHYSAEHQADLRRTILAPDAGLPEIERYFHGVVDFVVGGDQRRACLLANSILEIGESDSEVSGRCRANQDLVLGGFERALRNALARGELDGGLDVEATARMLMAQTYGLAVLSKTGIPAEEIANAVRAMLARLK
jgi:TetR/AcrR family transcriptional regulator, transcriptional repressor for nem operon